MLTFAQYIEKAREYSNLRNKSHVADMINISRGAIRNFETEKAYPSEHTLLKLANLANIPEKQALIDLSRWKAKNKPEVQKIWKEFFVEHDNASCTYLTFKDYVDRAKDNQGFTKDIEVAKHLNITGAAISDFSKGRNYPSQETVLKLAKLANIKPEQALIDFNLWKTKDKPNAHKVWQNLSKMIGCLSVLAIFYIYNSNGYKSANLEDTIPTSTENLYYV